MSGFDRHQLLAALMLLVLALLVSSGYPPAARWRRELRIASVALFLVAVLVALLEIGTWLGRSGP